MKQLFKYIGVSNTSVSHTEKVISAVGGFVAILIILLISQWAVGSEGAAMIVASMGASAVLLFAVPHGPLSQPWSVFGGHLISAVIGVTFVQLIANNFLAASLAVGTSIGVMYYLKCIHPPGGATALSAVLGGDAVHTLGYQFVITPILINVLVILAVGVIFNSLFSWRKYPSFLNVKHIDKKTKNHDVRQDITHEDLVYALSEIDSFVDVSENDLLLIYELINKKHQKQMLTPNGLFLGGYYSNGKYGKDWSVRQIVDLSDDKPKEDLIVIYKIVAGNGRRASGYSSKSDFLGWAAYQVERDEENWKKVDTSINRQP